MKTIVKVIVSVGIFLLLLCGGSLFYTKNSSGELAAFLDQLNPLVPESEVYVKTQDPESVNGYGTAAYKQTAAASDGTTRTLEFNGLQVLKKDRYLKLINKGAHVETYEEIPEKEVPQKALEKIK
ncbi:YxeA family protein [Enterococcus sp. JM9B]|uniref:YxeA family protein n=1 Tax=Enterococcus sp. JM9B TaxID=1857216 RepID=UPI001374B18A|nr:YxeA family protein [Enterococcus sp. JM9B]KAF1303594.1 hypothetical protein BAU16_04430 [Enterococcus sp. JM9B]